jgi:hypothetical protein
MGLTGMNLTVKFALLLLVHLKKVEAQEIQLNGTSKYRGEVQCYNNREGRWYNLCSDQWTIYNGDRVCKQLGFGYALEVGSHFIENGTIDCVPYRCLLRGKCEVTEQGCSPNLPGISLECSGQNGEC